MESGRNKTICVSKRTFHRALTLQSNHILEERMMTRTKVRFLVVVLNPVRKLRIKESMGTMTSNPKLATLKESQMRLFTGICIVIKIVHRENQTRGIVH